MLNILRKNTRMMFIIILLLLVPPFCFFGVDMAFRALFAAGFAGKIAGKTIPADRFYVYQKETRGQLIAQLSLMFGIQSTDQLSNLRSRFNDLIPRESLNQLTWERILLLRLADEYGIPASDGEVAAWISRFPLFQEGGSFSPARYELVVRSVFGSSSLQFEKELRSTLRIERLRRLVTDAVHVSDEEIKAAFTQEKETATAQIARFTGKDFAKEVQVTDAEIEARYTQKPEDFRQPAKIKVAYFLIPTEKEKSNEAQLEKATDLSLALVKNPDTAAAEKEFGLKKEETDLIASDSAVLPAAVIERLFETDKGEWTPAIETEKGIFVASPADKKESVLPVLEDCRDTVETRLKEERGVELARAEAKKKRDELEKAVKEEKGDFAAAAKKAGIELETPAPFTRKEAFSPVAFTLPQNEISQMIPTPDGGLFFAVAKKETPEFKREEELVERIRGAKKADLYQQWYGAKRRELNLVDLTAFLM